MNLRNMLKSLTENHALYLGDWSPGAGDSPRKGSRNERASKKRGKGQVGNRLKFKQKNFDQRGRPKKPIEKGDDTKRKMPGEKKGQRKGEDNRPIDSLKSHAARDIIGSRGEREQNLADASSDLVKGAGEEKGLEKKKRKRERPQGRRITARKAGLKRRRILRQLSTKDVVGLEKRLDRRNAQESFQKKRRERGTRRRGRGAPTVKSSEKGNDISNLKLLR